MFNYYYKEPIMMREQKAPVSRKHTEGEEANQEDLTQAVDPDLEEDIGLDQEVVA
jgi:hypothetical protein